MEPYQSTVEYYSCNSARQPQHISLYANAAILYIMNSDSSIPPLYNVLDQFGRFSGFTINWGKNSELMPVFDDKEQIIILNTIGTKNPCMLMKLNWKKEN